MRRVPASVGLLLLFLCAFAFGGCGEDSDEDKAPELITSVINDYEYLQGKFFFLVDPCDDVPVAEPLSDIRVYVDDRNGLNNQEQQTSHGYVTLTGDFEDEPRGEGDWVRLVAYDDYFVQDDVYPGFPVLILSEEHRLDSAMTAALAVSFAYQPSGGGPPVQVGGTHEGSLVLKLIRPPAGMKGTNPFDLTQGDFAQTRNLELRNVYDLGDDLSPDDLTVKVLRKATQSGSVDSDRKGNHTFLEILGLDIFTEQGSTQTTGPDGKIDRSRLDYDSGLLVFRELHPFAPTDCDISRWFEWVRPDSLSEDEPEYRVPAVYTRSEWSTGPNPNLVSQYKIEVVQAIPVRADIPTLP